MASQRKVGAVLGYANILTKNLVNLVYTPMLLSFVGQADYGVYQTSNSFVFSLSVLSFGFSEAYVRFYTLKRARGTERDIRRLNGMYLVLYAIICAVALVLGLAFAAGARGIFSAKFTEDQVNLARILMTLMAFNVTASLFSTVFDAYITAHEQFRYQQSRQLLTTLATPFLAFALLNLGMGAVGVATAQLAIVLVLLGLNIRFAVVRLGMRFDLGHFDKALFRALAAFSAWIFANQICDLGNQSLPNVILGALSGASAVAVFSVSVQIRSVFYSLSTTMSSVFTPLINRIVAEGDDNVALTHLMTRVGRYQSMLFSFVLGGFVLLGNFFITHWAGEKFQSAYLMIAFMVAPLIIPLTQNTGIEIQRAKNRHKARSIAYLCMAAINVGLTIALAPALGEWAPVVGYVAYTVLGCGFFMNWYYQVHIGLDMLYFWRRVLPPLIAAALSCAACGLGTLILPVSNWFMFVLWGLVYSACYALLTWTVVATPEERGGIVSLARHKLLHS